MDSETSGDGDILASNPGSRRSPVLSEMEVRERLDYSPANTAITDQLYEFGKLLLGQANERLKILESKATAIAAYSIGIITVIASTNSFWKDSLRGRDVALLALGAFVALVAAWFAVGALRLQELLSLSQDDWLKEEVFQTADRLRRYHVLALWTTISSIGTVSEKKVHKIEIAQWLLVAAAVVMVFLVVDASHKPIFDGIRALIRLR